MDLKIGEQVRCGQGGPYYGSIGVVTSGSATWMSPERVYIRWEGSVISNGYRRNDPILETLQRSGKHCECPLNGDACCECGKFECEAPASEATRHEDERRAYGVNPETGEKILCWMDREGNPQD